MNALIRVTLALAAGALAFPVFAADSPTRLSPEAAARHASGAVTARARIAKVMAERKSAAGGSKDAAAVDTVNPTPVPGPRLVNAYRAYPPSCGADPLPDVITQPSSSARVNLYATDGSGLPENGGVEAVTVTVWRIPCSSSGNTTPYNTDGGSNALTLMRIDRDAANEGQTDFYPTFPLLSSDQGTTVDNFVRAAVEPNTVISEAVFDTPIFNSTTYTLENYPATSVGETLYNYAFNLIIDPFTTTDQIVTLSVAGYPNQPDRLLPIDGYMSTTWYDTTHSGEGMEVQVIDNNSTTRTLFAAWYTYDDNGIPFWITAQGVFTIGANTVNATGYYQTGGGFAGDFGSGTTQHIWGTVNFSFPSCSEMVFTFNGAASDVTGGPAGSGSRTWTRLADTNGLWCE